MKKIPILHIAHDDKFINAAWYLFEKAFPGKNKFIILKSGADQPLRHVDKQYNMIIEVQEGYTLEKLLNIVDEFRVVVLHGIDKFKGSVVLESSDKNNFLGIVFGAEIYNEEVYGTDFLGRQTRSIFKNRSFKNIGYRFLISFDLIPNKIKEYLRKQKYKDDIDFKIVLKQIKNFGAISNEFHQKNIEEGIIDAHSKFVPFSYYPIEFIIKESSSGINGQNILLGNSAFPTNNHLEAFQILKDINLGDRKVIVPLSYGNEEYAEEIINQGNKILPDNFESISDFLPLSEYHNLLSSCNIVIMNHYRPQAMGNIIASLYFGSKVFLNETVVYHYFKNLGCHIYLIDKDLGREGTAVLSPLSEEQVNHNRRVLREEFSTDVLVEKLRHSFRELFGIKAIENA